MTEENSKPQIRFAGFNDAWEQRKLSSMTSLITKGTTPLDKSGTGNINFVKIENIDNSSGEINITQTISESEHNGYLRRSQLKEGDILFSIAGTLGRVTCVKSSILPANTNQALAIIRLKEGNLNYIQTYLKGKAISDFIKKNPTVGAQPNLSLEQVSNLEIALPKKDEQAKIGEYFKNLDHLITLHQRKYDKLLSVKKSMLEKMFPKNGSNVPEIRFKGFTEAWERRKLGEVFNFHYGDGNNNPSNGGQYPVFGAGGVQGGYTKYNAENSIIIGHMGDAGCVSWGEGKHFVTYNGTITKPKDDIFPAKFGYYLLLNMNLRKYRGGSGLPFLTYDMLTEMETKCPNSKIETQKIAAYFSNLDRLITLHQRKLTKLQNIKKACLEKMFV